MNSAKEHGRLIWADVAKGASILLVVLLHVTNQSFMRLDWSVNVPGVEAFWIRINTLLLPVRMPLFFIISGYFAAASLDRPWLKAAVPRIVRPYYLYVVWLAILSVFFALGPSLGFSTGLEEPVDLITALLFGSSVHWFLYALALYFSIAMIGSHLNKCSFCRSRY